MNDQLPDRVDPVLDYIRGDDRDRDLSTKAVAIRLRRAAHHLETEARRRLTPQGMDLWELELLSNLDRNGGTMTIGAMQDHAQLTSGAITNRVSRLEKAGYVERVIDPRDRRQVNVVLTEAGRARSDDLIAANDAMEEEVLGEIDADVLRRLASDLRSFLVATEGPDPG